MDCFAVYGNMEERCEIINLWKPEKGKEKSRLKGFLAAIKRFKMFKQSSKSAFGIKSLQKQTAANNCSVCRTKPLNVRLRAAEIRFAQLKEGKPPILFILKKLIQANSPLRSLVP